MSDYIFIKNAREHNLCNLDLKIPRNKLVVVTGVSGSGKSSLAFDTVYAEGYRKYMDSLSTKARNVLDQIKRPEVDYIEGLSPVIAIEQRNSYGGSPRSTVGTVSEISEYARLLWAVMGQPYCPVDGSPVKKQTLDDCLHRIYEEPEGARIQILAPALKAKPSVLREELQRLIQRGFQRVRIYGEIRNLSDKDLLESSSDEVEVELVIDRLKIDKSQRSRLADSLELAFREGKDKATVLVEQNKGDPVEEILLSLHYSSAKTGHLYDALTPKHFSPNSPAGACPKCGGLGEMMDFDPILIIPDPRKSVKNGAVKAWRIGSKQMIIQRNAILKQLAEQLPFDSNAQWGELDEEIQNNILYGVTGRKFSFKLKPGNRKPEELAYEGVIADLINSQRTSSSDSFRARLVQYQRSSHCTECNGERLCAYSRHVRLEERTFPEFMNMPIIEAFEFVESRLFEVDKYKTVRDAVTGLKKRLSFLQEVGLGYLSLGREYKTLSGGEAQRVRLATQLGMGLVGVTYVLDEPSIGLHAQDNKKLIQLLEGLRDRGNTVIVVEHDAETMEASDWLIELGPGAGLCGGNLIFEGLAKDSYDASKSLVGGFLSKRDKLEKDSFKIPHKGFIEIYKASQHNLKEVDAKFPIGALTVVCGMSGSGKSTLVNDILSVAASNYLNGNKDKVGDALSIEGLEVFEKLARVDQTPIGKSPRSNPATYMKIFDLLRSLFAQTSLAKVRGYNAGRFSFNTVGGRCEKCKGDGQIKLDMQFLADVYVECPSCLGKRYNRETLDILFKGLNVADVLELTIDEAIEVFRHHPKVKEKLDTLSAVGLGYLKLGQPAPTLSGGESQRLKLSLELCKREQGKTLYILDEPTTGLHWHDIQRLMDVIFQLRDSGNTVIIIEHNLDVIALSDWVLELGPEGGVYGGEKVFEGELGAFLEAGTLTSRLIK